MTDEQPQADTSFIHDLTGVLNRWGHAADSPYAAPFLLTCLQALGAAEAEARTWEHGDWDTSGVRQDAQRWQKILTMLINQEARRLPYRGRDNDRCPVCRAHNGQRHDPTCDREYCCICGTQRVCCHCDEEELVMLVHKLADGCTP